MEFPVFQFVPIASVFSFPWMPLDIYMHWYDPPWVFSSLGPTVPALSAFAFMWDTPVC